MCFAEQSSVKGHLQDTVTSYNRASTCTSMHPTYRFLQKKHTFVVVTREFENSDKGL